MDEKIFTDENTNAPITTCPSATMSTTKFPTGCPGI